jgi:hypothetical protein
MPEFGHFGHFCEKSGKEVSERSERTIFEKGMAREGQKNRKEVEK